MDAFEKELKIGFLQEAEQLLSDTEQCFLDLEKNHNNVQIIEKIFRLAHNLKGSALAVGFMQMGEFTHELESLLLKLKKQEITIQSSTVSLLLQCNDHLQKWVKTLAKDMNAQMDCSHLLDLIQQQFTGEVIELVESLVVPDAIEGVFEEMLPPIPDVAPHFSDIAQSLSTAPQVEESIRVSLSRVDKLMNNVGELVILQTVLNQHKYSIESLLLQKTITQLVKITKDIQDISMGLRMIPLRPVFQKVNRIVRDTSQTLNKQIHFEVEGEDTELDKTVVDHLGDPLTHLIRNAVDHGIETPEERIAVGKPAEGRIFVKAYQSSGKMMIEIIDDGRGLDPQLLKRKAIEKGLISVHTQLADKDCQNLIFAPGFSTKTEATEISGRGVGMDVVKNNIEKVLRGEVSVASESGKGTHFLIQLPLTLAIIEGMIVSLGSQKFILPLANIHESLRLSDANVHFVTGLGDVLSLRNEEIPLYRLSQLLKHSTQKLKPLKDSIAIIVRSGTAPFAIVVDDVVGQQQVVIKSLGQEIKQLRGIVGGAILGDGKAALILDLLDLTSQKRQQERRDVSRSAA